MEAQAVAFGLGTALQCHSESKDGTTQNNSDGWFVRVHSFTGSWLLDGWGGSSIHFDSMSIGQGAASALPVFGEFMRLVYADPTLGYDVKDFFDIPRRFAPCGSIFDELPLGSYSDADSVGIELDLLEE